MMGVGLRRISSASDFGVESVRDFEIYDRERLVDGERARYGRFAVRASYTSATASTRIVGQVFGTERPRIATAVQLRDGWRPVRQRRETGSTLRIRSACIG